MGALGRGVPLIEIDTFPNPSQDGKMLYCLNYTSVYIFCSPLLISM